MSKINILAFSDIHNNTKAVEKLLSKEKAGFDVVVIAGDMGDDNIEEFFEIVSNYDCPVLYIYGNWDNKLSYSRKFAKNCIHLHQENISINGFSFTGFSGSKTHWGENVNVIAAKLKQEVKSRYKEHLDKIEKLEKETNEKSDPLREEQSALTKEYLEIIDKKTQKTKARIKELDKLENSLDKEIGLIESALDKLRSSKTEEKYKSELFTSYKKAEDENRRVLIEKLKSEGNDFSKTFLIAHERLFKTHIDVPDLFCHIFGHRHGFKHTIYRGTNFINVSALDDDGLFGPCDGTYGILKANGTDLEVSCKSIIDDN